LDLNSLIIAANINGVTDLVINKFDALKDLGIFKLYYKSKLMEFIDANSFEKFIIDVLNNNCCTIVKIYFSESAHTL
jgi:adenylosuccinate synthase